MISEGSGMTELATDVSLDAKDLEIISRLQSDGRMSFADIANDVGLTEKTVRARVQSLLDGNVIRIVALTTPAALGFDAIALVGLTCTPGRKPSEIAAALASIKGVDYVVVTSGRYSIVVEIVTIDRRSVLDIVENKILTEPGISGFEVFDASHLHYQKAGFLGIGIRNGKPGVRGKPLGEIDRQIAAVLGEDGRASYRSVSAALGISETQVRTRVASMLEARQMEILAIANPLAFSQRVVAWVAVRVLPGSSASDTADIFADMAEVTYILTTFGRFDLFVEVQAIGIDALYELVHRKLKTVPGIQELEAFPYFSLHYKSLNTL